MTREELADWITRHSYSRKRLADEIGVTVSAVTFWINGKRKVPTYAENFCQRIDKYAGKRRKI
jgi:predicted transcriptional regulator